MREILTDLDDAFYLKNNLIAIIEEKEKGIKKIEDKEEKLKKIRKRLYPVELINPLTGPIIGGSLNRKISKVTDKLYFGGRKLAFNQVNKKDLERLQYSILIILFYKNDLIRFLGLSED